jgi:hypothetical protein
MSRSTDRAAARPLPRGLRICPDCGEARGTTPAGWVSACWCSGLVCNRCGGRARRPITDYYDLRDGRWWHVPYFALAIHRCELAPGEPPKGSGWTRLEPDPDVVAYQEATTRLALAELADDDEIDVVDGDRPLGLVPVGRIRGDRPN